MTRERGTPHEKIGIIDPAAAPPETDAEAAASPTGRDDARRSREQQQDIARRHPQPQHFGAQPQPGRGDARLGLFLAVTAAALVALGVIAGAVSLLG